MALVPDKEASALLRAEPDEVSVYARLIAHCSAPRRDRKTTDANCIHPVQLGQPGTLSKNRCSFRMIPKMRVVAHVICSTC